MRVVFMGTPAFAVPTLQALLAAPRHEVVAVYTRADARSGRGSTLRPSVVKACAEQAGVPVHTPHTLRDEAVQQQLAAFAPDVIVVAAYGLILPQEVLDVAAYGCLNVHASLLPRWRGAAPVQRAVLAGEAEVGVCIMQMEAGLDTGAYHPCGSVPVGQTGCGKLSAQLAELGARGLLAALDGLETGGYTWRQQDETQATYAEKITKDEVLLAPAYDAATLLRRVQASDACAPARCVVCGREVTVLAAHAVSEELAPGAVLLQKRRIVLGCAEGAVELDEVKPQGKRTMDAQAWLAGLRGAEPVWCGVR